MKGKVIISVVSLILVVGVAIGVVVSVQHKNVDPQVQAQQRTVQNICQDSNYPEVCHESLSSVKGADSTDPKAYIATAVKASTDSVIKAFNMSDRLSTEWGNKDGGIKMALDDCKDLLQSALDSLDLSTNLVRENNIQGVHNQIPDFRNWLSAVISYQQACTEGFDDDKDSEKQLKSQLNTESLDHVQKITAVALGIVTDMTKMLEQFNVKLDLKPASRRLLGAEEVDSEGYPSWFSASDRKLLAKLQRGGWRSAIRPNAVVAKDGSGQFKTIGAAIASYPKGFKGRYAIYVKAGVYDEYITIPKSAINILMYGDGPTRTIVTGRKNFAEGVKTMHTATFANEAIGFLGKAMTFQNTAGPEGKQAVAFRNQGDQTALVGCHIIGYQDTLYVQTNRQFYRNCVISGTVDFIFGTSPAVIQHCMIIVRKPLGTQFNTVTADGTLEKRHMMNTGIVIQDCEIVPEAALFPTRFNTKTYLGRPWKVYSTAIVMESTLGDFIHPDGWHIWDNADFHETCYFAEYGNTGPGSNVARRVKWKGYHGLISRAVASRFTVGDLLKAGPQSRLDWLKASHVPHYLGFKN